MVAVRDPSSAEETRTRYAMSATASPSVSILSSYNASGENGSAVVGPGGFTTADGCTVMIRIDLSASPGLGKAYKSVKSRRASSAENRSRDRSNGATCVTSSSALGPLGLD